MEDWGTLIELCSSHPDDRAEALRVILQSNLSVQDLKQKFLEDCCDQEKLRLFCITQYTITSRVARVISAAIEIAVSRPVEDRQINAHRERYLPSTPEKVPVSSFDLSPTSNPSTITDEPNHLKRSPPDPNVRPESEVRRAKLEHAHGSTSLVLLSSDDEDEEVDVVGDSPERKVEIDVVGDQHQSPTAQRNDLHLAAATDRVGEPDVHCARSLQHKAAVPFLRHGFCHIRTHSDDRIFRVVTYDLKKKQANVFGLTPYGTWALDTPLIPVSFSQIMPLNEKMIAPQFEREMEKPRRSVWIDWRIVSCLIKIQQLRDSERMIHSSAQPATLFDSGDFFIFFKPADWDSLLKRYKTEQELVDQVDARLRTLSEFYNYNSVSTAAEHHLGEYAHDL